MPPFSITLVNDKTRFYDRFAVFIFLINTAAIVILFFLKGQSTLVKACGAITLLLLITAIGVYSKANWKTKRNTFFLLATAFTIIYWISNGFWWAAIVSALLAGLYQFAQKMPVVIVDSNHIHYPSFPPRSLLWPALNNILLKDGLLTIDLRNNTLIQQAVDEKITSINEQNFNEFCQQQLKKSAVQ